MTHPDRRQQSRYDMAGIVALTLHVGVLLSAALIVAGCAWRWIKTGQLSLDYELPATNLLGLLSHDFSQWMAGEWRPRLLINSGIALLIATPYARVMVSLFHFAFIEKNLKYSIFTLIVFSALTYALFANNA